MKSKRDYNNVKRELETSLNVVRKANNTLYIGITAILAWAINASNSTLCLLAYCIIIPIYYIALDYNIATMKLGSYLLVFHNDNWEERLHKANMKKKIKRHESSYRNSYIYASIATTVLFFCFLDYNNIGTFEIVQIIGCIILFLWFNIYVFMQKDNDIIKQIYIGIWEEVKREEEQG